MAVAAAAAGCGGETRVVTETVTRTETATETVATQGVGLPAAVAEKRDALLAAAETGDYERVAALAGPFEGGPAAYWRNVAATTGDDPLATLTRILRMPYTLFGGIYVWPFAYDKEPDELTDYERGLLGELADDFGPGTGYLGWRAGIEPDGDWIFYVAGD